MGQQFVGGLTQDDAGAPANPRKEQGPALGGVVVVPFLRRAVGAAAATGTKFPFQRSFVYAVAGHRLGGASADKNFAPAFGCEKGTADSAWIEANDVSVGIGTNFSGTFPPWKGNANSVTSRVLSTASAATSVADRIEGAERTIDRGTQISINGGTPPAVLIHSSHVFLVPRGYIYDRDETHQGATIASGVSEPYNSSKD